MATCISYGRRNGKKISRLLSSSPSFPSLSVSFFRWILNSESHTYWTGIILPTPNIFPVWLFHRPSHRVQPLFTLPVLERAIQAESLCNSAGSLKNAQVQCEEGQIDQHSWTPVQYADPERRVDLRNKDHGFELLQPTFDGCHFTCSCDWKLPFFLYSSLPSFLFSSCKLSQSVIFEVPLVLQLQF